MIRPPMIQGLTLCDDVRVDPATQKVSVLGVFTGLAMDAFPAVALPFCAFATFTAGLGNAAFVLEVELFTEEATFVPVYAMSGTLRFLDPLQTVYWMMRLSRCPFPVEGEYQFTLWIDDVWMAQRRLRVYSSEE